MPNYLITEGSIYYKEIDEITLEEKIISQPVYSYDVYADDYETADLICQVMGTQNYMILEEIPEEKAQIDPEDWYPFYRLN